MTHDRALSAEEQRLINKLGQMAIVDNYMNDEQRAWLRHAAAEIDRLSAQCAELEKDAARYRWLREHADRVSVLAGLPGVCTASESALLDAAIDAAIAVADKDAQ